MFEEHDRLERFQCAGSSLIDFAQPEPFVLPMDVQHWLEFWDDEQSDLVNLKNLEYWLRQSQRARQA